MNLAASTEQVVRSLEELLRGRERARRLILRAGPHWQELSVGPDRREFCHLCVKSARLPESHKLDPDKAKGLRDLGFAKPPGVGDWQRDLSAPGRPGGVELSALAEEMVYIARGLYGAQESLALDIEIDEREHPENPDLISAMRKLASPKRNESDRFAMYNAMANATFLVPLDPELDPDLDPEEALWAIGELRGRPVFAAFTDFRSLRLFAPLQHEYVPLHGSELFPLLEARRAGSVRVNPDGDVGGELYGHEIQSLAEGVRRFLRKRMH